MSSESFRLGSAEMLLVSFRLFHFPLLILQNAALSSVSLCLLANVCGSTLCNVLQTHLTGWTWAIKYLLLEYYLLRVYKPRYMEPVRFRKTQTVKRGGKGCGRPRVITIKVGSFFFQAVKSQLSGNILLFLMGKVSF